jgi:hypothetical protein
MGLKTHRRVQLPRRKIKTVQDLGSGIRDLVIVDAWQKVRQDLRA